MKYQVWYMKPEHFRDGIFGDAKFTGANLSETHVFLKEVETDGLGAVYGAMQGEVWSPNGEARELIRSKGLEHTSMCIGDVAVDDVGNAHVVGMSSFKAIGGIDEDAENLAAETQDKLARRYKDHTP